jgi:hypothetical protein
VAAALNTDHHGWPVEHAADRSRLRSYRAGALPQQ